jgi:hypothetical protein
MKHPTKILLLFILIFLTANSCKKDDDDNPSNDSDNFSEYFKCKINGVEFTTRSDFNCNGERFYYYPAGAGGLDEAYILLAGTDCSEDRDVALRVFNPTIPILGLNEILLPESADSISPIYYYYDSIGDGVAFDQTVSGHMNIIEFTPRDSTTMEFGKIEGTFEFVVSNEALDSTIHVTEGSFRFKVPNFW